MEELRGSLVVVGLESDNQVLFYESSHFCYRDWMVEVEKAADEGR